MALRDRDNQKINYEEATEHFLHLLKVVRMELGSVNNYMTIDCLQGFHTLHLLFIF